jgi:hypothetical protein
MIKIKFILGLIIVTSLFSFKGEQENKIVGIWKMEIFKVNNDTLFNFNDEYSTLKYYNKINEIQDSSNETKSKINKRCKDEFDNYHQIRIELTSKFLKSYKVDKNGKKIKINENISYKLIDYKIEMNLKDKLKYNYEIEYDLINDKLIIKQSGDKLEVINIYSRTEK